MKEYKYDGDMESPVSVPGIGLFYKDKYTMVTDEQAKKLTGRKDFKLKGSKKPKEELKELEDEPKPKKVKK